MSFQHFRLGEQALHQPLPPHLAHIQPTTSSFPATLSSSTSFSNNPPKLTKQPYGSGDTDDGYTLIFPNLAAFHEWRLQEEDRQTVEFVKGDTHGSKAVPPRFKEHTKLVCARHSRSGRKKYVKKHPERVRKVPSRKLEGTGCPASISFKTYFDTEEVRACYSSHHSHEVGPANLPFTRKGRKAAQAERELQQNSASVDASTSTPAPSNTTNAIAGPSSVLHPQPHPPPPMFLNPQSIAFPPPIPQPFQNYPPTTLGSYSPFHPQLLHERWENMTLLFNSVREHARTFEYPSASIAALESILIRLYLESPVPVHPQPAIASIIHNNGAPRPTPPASTPAPAPVASTPAPASAPAPAPAQQSPPAPHTGPANDGDSSDDSNDDEDSS
ncbi:hypothetical protein H0H87_004525 [Tephrocybe sp. NHM501043]|nr:hypothetical protein H0H87_004525 [Tephrocybe sp. NHM501043]